MSSKRLFVPQAIRAGRDLWLDGERAHYLSRVLRVRPGTGLVLFDGSGGEYDATVSEVSRRGVRLVPGAFRAREAESPLDLRLIQGVSRGERMDVVVQKATELGVRRISPVITAYSVVRLDAGKGARKAEHWLKVAQGACEQCGRNEVPDIDVPVDLRSVLGETRNGVALLLSPRAGSSFQDLERPRAGLSLLVGPEGGLNDAEHEAAVTAGFRPITAGPRILRTETAALAALAILQARFGDM
ncbi:MAG: 16S rRNA (uracil(1498)-N(3))-methyltransferase [Woeseiaceae bacterium]